jgi:hypothetical protein
MHAVIAGHRGCICYAVQHPDLSKSRPAYAFIADGFLTESGFEKSRYLTSRWPSINAGANPNAIGSHILPDPSRPVKLRSKCPAFREFLTNLKTIAAVKATSTNE